MTLIVLSFLRRLIKYRLEKLDGGLKREKITMPADNELSAKLTRRLDRNDALEQGQQVTNTYRTTGVSIYTEFSEFSRKQIKDYEKAFKKSLYIFQ